MAAVASHELMSNDPVRSLRLKESAISNASETSESPQYNSITHDPTLPHPASRASLRRDSEHVSDYYQSENAGRAYLGSNTHSQDHQIAQAEQALPASRSSSTSRPQSAGRDINVGVGRTSMESATLARSGSVQRRTSQRSTRGSDNRRMAIVEADVYDESRASPTLPQRGHASEKSYQLLRENGLLARRGIDSSRLEGLALVAPPGVNLSTITAFSPAPSSAPPTAALPTNVSPKANSSHHRSMSDAQSHTQSHKRTPSRDVGIVGTLETMQAMYLPEASLDQEPQPEPPERGRPSTENSEHRDPIDRSLTAPVFQTPKSRSPSPFTPAPAGSSSESTSDGNSIPARTWTVDSAQQLTGQEKEMTHAVAARSAAVDPTPGVRDFRRSPSKIPSGLPLTDLPGSDPHSHGDHSQRSTARLPFKRNQSGPAYLHYQPGVHATAGPLPSPPRHILPQTNTSPPPRPPRLLPSLSAASKVDAHQLKRGSDGQTISSLPQQSLFPITREDSDFSIAAVSVSSNGSVERTSKTPEGNQRSRGPPGPKGIHEKPSTSSSRSGSHVREGAFPASSVFLSDSSEPMSKQHLSHPLDKLTTGPSLDGLPSSAAEGPSRLLRRTRNRADIMRDEGWASESAETVGSADEESPPSSYPSSNEDLTHVSIPNLPSDDAHINVDKQRASLPAPPPDPLNQFHSIPRPPSVPLTHNQTHTSSPSSHLPRKAPSPWPEAMNLNPVLGKKTAAERALAYATRIQELAGEDTGLRDWLYFHSRKEHRVTHSSSSVAPHTFPRGIPPNHRRISHGSMGSEITFPIRADSYTATDLSLRPTTDISSPSSLPSSLPYPSLAHGVGMRTHAMHELSQSDSSGRGTSSPAKTLGGAFFASLGRKASSRKHRTLAPPPINKLVSSRHPTSLPLPRPVKIAAPPTIPGGPRAPPGRANSATPAPPPQETPRSENQDQIQDQNQSVPPHPSTDVFNRQVEILTDILPHADKDVLAIYLRRANDQDPMLAIGAYLEDEKQGTLLSA